MRRGEILMMLTTVPKTTVPKNTAKNALKMRRGKKEGKKESLVC
jgi:hypothetical protein